MGEAAGRTCSLRGLGAVPMSYQGLRESSLGKGDQMEELEWGRGGAPQGWVWDAQDLWEEGIH